MQVISVITGDIVNSQGVIDPNLWLKPLKNLLNKQGTQPKDWSIFSGDSFQLEKKPEEALKTAIHIKATIKTIEELDVRMAIGIGDKTFEADRIMESTGAAFIHSGHGFDQLKKQKRNLILQSGNQPFDEEMNMLLKLGLVIMDHWSTTTSELARVMLANPGDNQKALGKKLGISQSSVSERYKRGFLEEVMEMEQYYRKRIAQEWDNQ